MAISTMNSDKTRLPLETDEELAGPPHVLTPVSRQQRISSMDVLRGFALLGILIMNVTSFGLPSWAYSIPLGTPKPTFSGTHAHINTVIWFLRWILAEGKMRGLFSLLFGAGVILLTSRAEKRGNTDGIADIFLRRNLWLTLFGVLHAYFIWDGDILYWYGLTALIFLYPCRKLKAKTLLITGGLVLVVNILGPLGGGQALKDINLSRKAEAATVIQKTGKPLTESQRSDQKAWEKRLAEWKPDQKTIDQDMATMRAGYISAQMYQANTVVLWESSFYYSLGFCDMLGMMLIGMGLLQCGFLTAKLSYKTYVLVAVIGYLIALPVIAIGAWKAWASGFDLITSEIWMLLPYDLGRAPGVIANASLVLLIVKSGILPWVTKRLASVGQTALSNYLLTSTLCKTLFVWGPWKLYGELEYYQLYYVVAAVWALNLFWSPIWLRYFEFGPAEWLWRSLTYWKKQPMRLRPNSELTPAIPVG
jgi:uncharacterized protein